jgi:ferric-dicitrate binding protein FerR (iron transport regulator)
MNINENISKIIANYIIGNITTKEEEVLQEWLSDSYNETLFLKIVEKETVVKELTNLKAIDTAKAYKVFKRKKQKRKSFTKTLQYAAVLLVPLVVGTLIWYVSGVADHTQNISQQQVFNSESITVVDQDGKRHTIMDKDTIVDISDSKLLVKNGHIRYEKQVKKTVKQTVYNTINIPAGKKYRLELSDGTVVHLNAKTTMKYPVDFIGETRNVQLVSGEAFFEVVKNEKPFVLGFGINKIKVLGTKFNVKSYGEEQYEHVTLEEGSISLSNSENEIELVPNQQAIIEKDNLSMKIESVDANLYSAWRTGFLNYREEKLSSILFDLKRQYNVNLFYQNEDVKNKRLSISINTNKNINQVLRAIEATGGVIFKIKNDNVIIMKK